MPWSAKKLSQPSELATQSVTPNNNNNSNINMSEHFVKQSKIIDVGFLTRMASDEVSATSSELFSD